MFPLWLQNHLCVKNTLTLVCVSLTLFLICQEVVTLTITKPTTTSKEEKELETSDFPEVLVCLVPGFDAEIMFKKYGYTNSQYYRGLGREEFVGWNGKNECGTA